VFSLLCYTFDFVNKQIRSYNAKLFLKIKAKTNDESLVVALLLLPELVHGAVRFTLSLKRIREKRRGEHAHKSTRFDFSKRKHKEWGLFPRKNQTRNRAVFNHSRSHDSKSIRDRASHEYYCIRNCTPRQRTLFLT